MLLLRFMRKNYTNSLNRPFTDVVLQKSDFWIQNDTLSNRTFHSKFLSAYTFRPISPCWSGPLHTATQRCRTDIHRHGLNRIQEATILEDSSLTTVSEAVPMISDLLFANYHPINSSGWPPPFSFGLFIRGHLWERVSIGDMFAFLLLTA